MNEISNLTRQQVIGAYRFHGGLSPSRAAERLLEEARARGFTDRTNAPPGMVLQLWATARNPPRWAVYAAAAWLAEHVEVSDPAEQAALAQVLEILARETPPPE